MKGRRGRVATGVGGLLLLADVAFGTQVVYVGKRSFVIIDAGRDQGLSNGDDVCFFAKDDAKIACGKVVTIRRALAGVALTPEDKAKIPLGTAVKSDRISAQATATATEAEVKALAAAAGGEEVKPKANAESYRQRPRIGVAYVATPVLPYSYHIPAYNLDNEILGAGSLWRQDRKVQSSLIGGELSFTWPFTAIWAVKSALRARYITTDNLSVDYDRTDPSISADSKSGAADIGISSVAEYSQSLSPTWVLLGRAGLDIDRSKVSYTVKQNGGAGGDITSFSSTMVAFSLRAGGGIAYAFESFAAELGLDLLLPIAGKASASGGDPTLKDIVADSQKQSSAGDLKSALAHKRSSYGLELQLGVSRRF